MKSSTTPTSRTDVSAPSAEHARLVELFRQKGPGWRSREYTIAIEARAEGEADDGRLRVVLSSEYAVERYDWWNDETFLEVIDHRAEAMNLERAKDGLPFLYEHGRDIQVGLIEDIALGDDRKLHGFVRQGNHPYAAWVFADIRDGIRIKVSLGYAIGDYEIRKLDDGREARFYRTTPLEASTVSIPADYEVGFGRSELGALRRELTPTPAPARRAMEIRMEPDEIERQQAAAREAGRKEGLSKAVEIRTLCERHGFADKADELIRSDMSAEQAGLAVLSLLEERGKAPAPKPSVELTEREKKQYSVSRAILSQVDGKVEAGFEREVHDELSRHMPPQYKMAGGILVPFGQERAGLDSLTATKGNELKFTQAGELIDLLRARLKLATLGARVLSGLTGPVSFPRKTAGASGGWVAENPGSDAADTNLLLELVTLAMKTYQSSTSFSRQLLIAGQSASVNAEQLVREDLAQDVAQALEIAGINGSGASNQPRGILNTTGIGVVAMGTNGLAPTFGKIIDLETTIAAANGDVGDMSILTTPGMRGKMKQTEKASSTGQFLWTGQAGIPGVGEVNGYAAHASNNVPSNLTKGTSSGVCHAIIQGVFAELVLGMWGAMELVVDPLRLKKQGMIEVTSFTVADWIVRRPGSFAAIKDALTT